MNRILTILVALATILCVNAQSTSLPRSTPEEKGVPTAAVETMIAGMAAEDNVELHGIIVVKDGCVIAEYHPAPFTADDPHALYSCSKTFVALALGVAYDRGLFKPTDLVVDILPEVMPDTISAALAAMTVHDLLTMSGGIKPNWTLRSKCSDWLRAYFSQPVEKPHEFMYDSMCTYALSAIVQRLSRMTTLEYLQENVFTPMGIYDADWEVSPEGICTGGWGLQMTSESLAKTGQLLLNKGKWDGAQLISGEWLDKMMTTYVNTSETEGYGYQIWSGSIKPTTWRADGALGQYIIVDPATNIVVAITQASLLGGVENRLPVSKFFQTEFSDKPLSSTSVGCHNPKDEDAIPLAKGVAEGDNQYYSNTYFLSNNPAKWASVRVEPQKEGGIVLNVITTGGESIAIPCANAQWAYSTTQVLPPYSISPVDRLDGIRRPFRLAGSYGWQDGKMNVKVYYPGFISGINLDIDFDALTLSMKMNYSKTATEVTLTKR